jgi:acyl-coenzyme A synthetase/AMP-(fatty) acid ligase/very-short-patch-repair endonuclease
MSYPYQITSVEQYHNDYKKSIDEPETFWSSVAENFVWKKKWDKVLEWNFKEPKVEWFKGAKLNITENCIDRHLATMGEKPAIIWEPNDPNDRVRIVTYNRLHKRVCQVAQMLRNNGVKKGDRVCIYMGMVPELAYAVLGCARIGAIHSVIFGGFSAQSIADRLDDAQAEYIITCDGAYRGGKDIPLKSVIDDALIGNKTVKRVIVYTRTRTPVSMIKGRDVWWEDEMEHAEQQLGEAPVKTHPNLPEGKEPGRSQYRETARKSTYNLLKELSQKHKDNPTDEENILWQYLRANKTGYHIRRQHIIDEFITDFVCLKKKVVIEVDGGYHTNKEQKEYDEMRTSFLSELGYQVIRFMNEEIRFQIDDVVKKIKETLDNTPDGGVILSNLSASKVLPSGKDLGGASKVLPAGEDLGGASGWDAEPMDAEDPLFILYTSGSTGKPKGVVHSCAGYMLWTTYTFVNVFQYKPGDIHFCTADIGWITGHSYIVYGPLSAGATSMMFEGIPTYPDAGRFWDIIDKHKVNILYTAPTAIRSLMSFGLDPLKGKDLSSLKILGTVGEPINEEAWHWYDENVGKKKCPIVDTWWQTETGGCLISNMAGITPAKPSWATLPMPGVQPVLVDEKGVEVLPSGKDLGWASGNLCIKAPWPGILRTTWGDHERCRTNYFATYENLYFTGDGALKDKDGNFRITGRVDDVLNVSGHRIGTAEVENAINMHAGVVESAVVGYPHDVKGQGIYAYVIYNGHHGDEELRRKDILQTVTRIIGPIAKPDKIQFVSGLPKTRSGKIMRRILRKIAEGETSNLGDTTTLLDPGVVEEIKNGKL